MNYLFKHFPETNLFKSGKNSQGKPKYNIVIHIQKAKHLVYKELQSVPKFFCVISLIKEDKFAVVKKTKSAWNASGPRKPKWNEHFHFTSGQAKQIKIEVFHKNSSTKICSVTKDLEFFKNQSIKNIWEEFDENTFPLSPNEKRPAIKICLAFQPVKKFTKIKNDSYIYGTAKKHVSDQGPRALTKQETDDVFGPRKETARSQLKSVPLPMQGELKIDEDLQRGKPRSPTKDLPVFTSKDEKKEPEEKKEHEEKEHEKKEHEEKEHEKKDHDEKKRT